MSDLHLELDRKHAPVDTFRFSAPNITIPTWVGPPLDVLVDSVDMVVLACDVDVKTRGVTYASVVAGYTSVPVVYVAGNHEFYGSHLGLTRELREAASALEGVFFLDNDRLDLDINGHHVVVLGTTLWTNFMLFGADKQEQCMRSSLHFMNDFQMVHPHATTTQFITPQDLIPLHDKAVAWLDEQLSSVPSHALSIVVTHHAPSARSVSPIRARQPVSAAYATDLEHLIERHRPTLWVHGHTHWPCSYRLHGSRIVSHPFGYPHERQAGAPMVLTVG